MADRAGRRLLWSESASDALEEHLENVSRQVMHLAEGRAARHAADVVSVSDVVRAIAEIEARPGLYSVAGGSKPRGIAKYYVLAATSMVALGLIAALYSAFDNLSSTTRLSLLFALVGVLVGVSASVLDWFSARKNDESQRIGPLSTDSLAWDFIGNYQELELELRSLVSQRSGESSSRGSIGTLAPLAARIGALSDDDVKLLNSLSKLRNETVHGRQADRGEYLSGIYNIHRVLERIRVGSY